MELLFEVIKKRQFIRLGHDHQFFPNIPGNLEKELHTDLAERFTVALWEEVKHRHQFKVEIVATKMNYQSVLKQLKTILEYVTYSLFIRIPLSS